MGSVVLQEKRPVLGRHDAAAGWLRIWADLGRAPRTIDAYARGLAEYLDVCEREGVDPVMANRAHAAVFVRQLTSRPSHYGANVVALDSGGRIVRLMLALAYDAALRREELCLLDCEDLDPGPRMRRIRAEHTKNRLERVVPYPAPTGVLLSDYLAHRATISRPAARRRGRGGGRGL